MTGTKTQTISIDGLGVQEQLVSEAWYLLEERSGVAFLGC